MKRIFAYSEDCILVKDAAISDGIIVRDKTNMNFVGFVSKSLYPHTEMPVESFVIVSVLDGAILVRRDSLYDIILHYPQYNFYQL